MAEQAVSDAVSGRLGDTEKYVRKALAGSVVGFLTGASGLMMQGASLGKVLSLGFGEGFLGSTAEQGLLNEDGEINWALAIGDGMFSAVMAGLIWKSSIKSQTTNNNEAAGVHPGKLAAESDDISYESIMRALRKSDTPEGYAVASLLKRGKIELRIEYAHPRGYGGLYKFKTNYITIYTSVCSTPLNAAGYTAHETRHFLQKLTTAKYAKIHEFEAFVWQRAVDRYFPLKKDVEIWNLLNTHKAYKNLKMY